MSVVAYYQFKTYPWKFSRPDFSEKLKDSYTKSFGTVRQKIFWRENIKPLSSSIKFFETKNFPKNSATPFGKISALWDKKLSTENRDTPPLIQKFFLLPENFRKT